MELLNSYSKKWSLSLFTTLAVVTVLFAPKMTIANETPPTDKDMLFQWLSDRSYKDWASESAPHQSAGPHPVSVIAYLNRVLNESLAANADTHPKGSAAVKELLDANGDLNGWAVSLKTDDDSNGGQGWFWYEILGNTADSNVVASDNGVPLCFGCHTPGKDFVLIPHPLK